MPPACASAKGSGSSSPISRVIPAACSSASIKVRATKTATACCRSAYCSNCGPIGRSRNPSPGSSPAPKPTSPCPLAPPKRFITKPEDGRVSTTAPVSIPCGTYRHTTHLSSIFQVCYPYHPFFGQTVKLVRRIRRQTSDSVIIELPDGLEIAIPFWMLDPLACNEVKDADAPSVSTNALLALDELLKSSGLLLPKPSSTSGPSQSKGVSDVPESCGPSSPPNRLLPMGTLDFSSRFR